MRLPLVVAEVVGAAARRDDQMVVVDFAVGQLHALRATSTADRLRQPHLEVVLPAQDPANRRRDVAGRQPGRGHLIEQRREDVVVAPIDQQ